MLPLRVTSSHDVATRIEFEYNPYQQLSSVTIVRDTYSQQNNSTCTFEPSMLHCIAITIRMWNELTIYHPHTVNAAILHKRVEDGKIVQLLASLGSKYEDLHCHIRMFQ
ncbi:hypothetical protein CR513_45265, partial [Mucuna pruriens]